MVDSQRSPNFRDQLPLVYELKDLIEEPNSPTAYFQNFENSINDDISGPSKMRIWERREQEFQKLDKDSWNFLKDKALPYLTTGLPNGRGFEQLISALNEARGYICLMDMGCSGIQFIPESNKSGENRPDLEGKLDGAIVLCEVKTLHISDKEVKRRRGREAGETQSLLCDGFFNKLRDCIKTARGQMISYATNDTRNVRRIVYIILYFDDFLCEHKVTYYEQIKLYLSNNPFPEIEIVLHYEEE